MLRAAQLGEVPESSDEDEGGAGGVRTVFVALHKTIVRAGSEMDSTLVGKLRAGEEIECLAKSVNTKGVVRVQFERGWVSMFSSSGEQLLEKINGAPTL